MAALPAHLRVPWKAVVAPWMRRLDIEAARSADMYIATSTAVKMRIESYYRRAVDAIIPPPVNEAFSITGPLYSECSDYFLWAGRVVEPYKRVSLLVEAFKSLPYERLIVAGDGRDRERLEAGAPKNVKFLGEVDTATLASLYRGAAGVVMPSEDDFGMLAVEAMACGTPVVAFGRGGSVDTVIPELTGVLFDEANTQDIVNAVRRFRRAPWSSSAIVEHAAKFSRRRFIQEVERIL